MRFFEALNALDLPSPPYGDGLALLDKLLRTYSSPSAHALFLVTRMTSFNQLSCFNEPDPAGPLMPDFAIS